MINCICRWIKEPAGTSWLLKHSTAIRHKIYKYSGDPSSFQVSISFEFWSGEVCNIYTSLFLPSCLCSRFTGTFTYLLEVHDVTLSQFKLKHDGIIKVYYIYMVLFYLNYSYHDNFRLMLKGIVKLMIIFHILTQNLFDNLVISYFIMSFWLSPKPYNFEYIYDGTSSIVSVCEVFSSVDAFITCSRQLLRIFLRKKTRIRHKLWGVTTFFYIIYWQKTSTWVDSRPCTSWTYTCVILIYNSSVFLHETINILYWLWGHVMHNCFSSNWIDLACYNNWRTCRMYLYHVLTI